MRQFQQLYCSGGCPVGQGRKQWLGQAAHPADEAGGEHCHRGLQVPLAVSLGQGLVAIQVQPAQQIPRLQGAGVIGEGSRELARFGESRLLEHQAQILCGGDTFQARPHRRYQPFASAH